jgi:hypothetical protein
MRADVPLITGGIDHHNHDRIDLKRLFKEPIDRANTHRV